MLLLFVIFVVLSAIIIASAMLLAKFGDEISEQTGLGGSVTGLVLLAGATSLPELSVGFSAVRLGAPDLTAGGVLGSSLMNLLILAILDLASRRPGKILTRSAAAHALSATVGALLTAIILLGMLVDTSWSILRIGPASWGVIGAYALCARLIFLDQRESTRQVISELTGRDEPSQSREQLDSAQKAESSRPLWLSILGFLVATIIIFFTAPELAETADRIASVTGLGRTFVGTLFVAAVTSLPEAVSTVSAIRLGAIDMAISNIFGSNAFNMVILAVLDVASPTPILASVSATHAVTAACVLITTAVALLSVLYRAEKRLWMIEPDAALMALLILAGLYLVYLQG